MAIDLVTGWTEPIDYTLKTKARGDSVASAIDISSMTVTIVARDTDNTAIAMSGVLSKPGALGLVRFSPTATDIDADTSSEYRVRWKVVDGASKVSYFPNGKAEQWNVRA